MWVAKLWFILFWGSPTIGRWEPLLQMIVDKPGIIFFQIKSLKSSSNPQESFSDLECVICQSVPEPENGNLHIFSCQQHHLLCHSCLRRIEECPICKQDFKAISSQRNFLAERIALQMKQSNEKSQKVSKLGNHSHFEGPIVPNKRCWKYIKKGNPVRSR